MTVALAPTQLVFESMGTVVTVISTVAFDVATTEAVTSAFRELDERFSLYREDSEASAISRDRSLIRSASESYRDMYWDAVAWLVATGGAFTRTVRTASSTSRASSRRVPSRLLATFSWPTATRTGASTPAGMSLSRGPGVR